MPVGSSLTKLRRDRGKTLPDLEAATKIMGRLLSALENERWDELPAPAYVRGYIASYAQFLGVDPAPLLEEYARDIAGQHAVERGPIARIPQRTVVPHRLDVHAIPPRAWRLIAVAAIVVVVVVWGITALIGRNDTPTPIAPETTSTTSTEGVPAESQAHGSTEAAAGSFTLKITVAEGQSSWLQVKVDSATAFEGTLEGGQSKTWTVSEQAIVRVGKPAAVVVTRDGQTVEVPVGVAGGIAEVTLDAGTE